LWAVLWLGFLGALFAAEPFVGTWKLDLAKSSGTIPKDEIVTIERRDSMLTFEVAILNVGPEGRRMLIKFSAPSAGGMARVEEGPYDGVILRRVSDNVMELTYLMGAKKERTTRVTLTKDGRTMTSRGKTLGSVGGSSWTMVFERQ
jgi:hypothetical protein